MDQDFEAFLGDISDAFLSEDFELWRSRTRVPLCLDLPSGLKIIKCECEARGYFQDCLTAICLQRIDAIICQPVAFEECDDGVALATYETHLFSGSHRTAEPLQSTAMLRNETGVLRAGSILNALDFRACAKVLSLRTAHFEDVSSHGQDVQVRLH